MALVQDSLLETNFMMVVDLESISCWDNKSKNEFIVYWYQGGSKVPIYFGWCDGSKEVRIYFGWCDGSNKVPIYCLLMSNKRHDT